MISREFYQEIAMALESMVEETKKGGWSTHQTDAMEWVAEDIWSSLGGRPGPPPDLKSIAARLTGWIQESSSGSWSANNSHKQMDLAQKIWAHIGRNS